MKPIWTGRLKFGLIIIPVKVYPATKSRGVKLSFLREGDLCPIRNVRVCETSGEEVPFSEIVRGYEYEEGEYVVVSQEDLDQVKAESREIIELTGFVEAEEIDSLYYQTPYYLEPEKVGERAYVILREALQEADKVGMASYVWRNQESLAVVKPEGRMLVLNQLRFATEVREAEELKVPERVSLNSEELRMAGRLIERQTVEFEPEQYQDTYTEELKELIERKIEGKKEVKMKLVEVEEEEATPAEEILERLRASMGV